MPLTYGVVKSVLRSDASLKGSKHHNETQYHLHFALTVDAAIWDVAVNVGTNDSDDLLRYKIVYDFQHPVTQQLSEAARGAMELTGTQVLPALDFLRSTILQNTGKWRDSDVMDGTEFPEPVASLKRLLDRASREKSPVYVFGRFYADGSKGIHDTHMNQGSSGSFLHRAGDDSNDHNDIWQDGALLVDLGQQGWVAYFACFDKQWVPTDDLGNPKEEATSIQ